MGHSTNSGFVHLATATEYLEKQREDRAGFRFAMNRPTIESAAISVVVETWRDEECGRFENECIGSTSLRAPLTLDLAERAVDSSALPNEWHVNSGRTVVVPIVDDADVKVAERRITVELSAEEAATLLGRLASGEHGLRQASYQAHELALRELGPGVVSAVVVKSPKRRSPAAKTTEGAAALEYFLVADGLSLTLPTETASSQSKARQAAIAYAESHPNVRRLEVHARMVRPGSAALVVIERPEPASTTFTLAVQLATVKPGAATIGYHVAFDSHH